jgi:four helix bundle protein
MGARNFRDLKVWQQAHALALEIYRLTAAFPREERFLMVQQLRRAALSVPANIAEGSGRLRGPDKAHFYTIARASADEVSYLLLFSKDLGWIADDAPLQHLLGDLQRGLHALIGTWRRGGRDRGPGT